MKNFSSEHFNILENNIDLKDFKQFSIASFIKYHTQETLYKNVFMSI